MENVRQGLGSPGVGGIHPWLPPRRVRQSEGPVQIALDAGVVVGGVDEDHVDFGGAKKVPVVQDAVKLQVDLGVGTQGILRDYLMITNE